MKFRRFSQREVFLLALLLAGIMALRVECYLELRRGQTVYSGPTRPQDIKVLPDFKLSLLHAAATNEGSWISMAFDPQGRVIVSPQEREPVLRLTLSGGKVSRIEPISQPVGSAMGLLYASNGLYLDCRGPEGWGVYRMNDSDGNYGPPRLLCPLPFTDLAHGCHAIVLGPEGKLYVVCGDHTTLPPGISPTSPFQHNAEDQLLPSEPDPTGWDAGQRVPEGFVLRMDLEGKNRELFAGGARNNYCVAFNSDGELFGFDNDHDWDFGLPWYRPIRIVHWISAGDFGLRRGCGKFPEYYQDTLPPARDLGIGAPSAVAFASPDCAFPAPYKNIFFMVDWQFGRILAVRPFPRGATYGVTVETVARGNPLNVTAMAFGPDGNLYFITGGVGRTSGLYCLQWAGRSVPPSPETPGQLAAAKEGSRARQLRRRLESYQGRPVAGSLDVIWPSLSSDDRWIRYAARAALECQDAAEWKNRALAETNSNGGLTALMALARSGPASAQPELFSALQKFQWPALTPDQRLLKLRVMELSFIRQGRPPDSVASAVMAELDPLYPSASDDINHELCQLLLYLNDPRAIAKTLGLLDKASTVEEQIYYVMRLRTITNGWTLPERKEYLGWFFKDHDKAPRSPELVQSFKSLGRGWYFDGPSFDLYLKKFRKEAIAALTPAELNVLGDYARLPPPPPTLATTHKFVKAWRMDDLLPHLDRLKKGRHLARGLGLLEEAQCLSCHHFGNEGGSFGPNLTAVGSRMSAHDILESILEPSKVIDPSFQNTVLTLTGGDDLLGRVVAEDAQNLVLITNQEDLASTTIPRTNIVSRSVSRISPMPEGLVNSLSEDEIWDLVACLSRGYHTHASK